MDFRQHCDIHFAWGIFQAGDGEEPVPRDLAGRDLAVTIEVNRTTLIDIADFTVNGNVVSFTWPGREQHITGPFRLILTENDGKEGMVQLDEAGPFRLVRYSSDIRERSGMPANVEASTVRLETVVAAISDDAIPETIARKTWVNGVLENYYTKEETDGLFAREQDVREELIALQSAGSVFRAGLRFRAGVKFSRTPKASASGTGALRTAPALIIRGNGAARVLHVSHPLAGSDGAELVLLRYARRNGKVGDVRGPYKKGWCVASGRKAARYFAFSAETPVSSLTSFLSANIGSGKRHFGIALRIPNPDYAGPATKLKNATFKGVAESLWSDVLSVGISHNTDKNYWGVGII